MKDITIISSTWNICFCQYIVLFYKYIIYIFTNIFLQIYFVNILRFFYFWEVNLNFRESYCHQFTMLISVTFLQFKCVLSFRLAHEWQYQKSVKVFNVKHFSNILKKVERSRLSVFFVFKLFTIDYNSRNIYQLKST